MSGRVERTEEKRNVHRFWMETLKEQSVGRRSYRWEDNIKAIIICRLYSHIMCYGVRGGAVG